MASPTITPREHAGQRCQVVIDTLFCLFQSRISFLPDPDFTATGAEFQWLGYASLGFAPVQASRLAAPADRAPYPFASRHSCFLGYHTLLRPVIPAFSGLNLTFFSASCPALPRTYPRLQYPSTAHACCMGAEAKLDTSLFMQATTLGAPLLPAPRLPCLIFQRLHDRHQLTIAPFPVDTPSPSQLPPSSGAMHEGYLYSPTPSLNTTPLTYPPVWHLTPRTLFTKPSRRASPWPSASPRHIGNHGPQPCQQAVHGGISAWICPEDVIRTTARGWWPQA
jgi:hypothetical protein